MSEQSIDLMVDLASAGLGGAVLEANDEFFAPKENLILDAAPISKPGEFTSKGQWMDGWETRRRREPGHDWAVLRLGRPGIIRCVVVDTAHFDGNHPEECSLEVVHLPGEPGIVELVRDPGRWREVVGRSPVRGDHHNEFPVADPDPATHARLVIYPDGGVARLRLLGDPIPPGGLLDGESEVDLASVSSGARVIDCSDKHYSNPNRMLMTGRSKGMWDGWQTKRRREPGSEWAVIRLAGAGSIHRLEIDTSHFKGNSPGSCDVEAASEPGATPGELAAADWRPLLAETPLSPDGRHELSELEEIGTVTHLRLKIHPDGGVARFRAFGRSSTPWHAAG